MLWVRRAIVLPGFKSGWHTLNTYLVLRADRVSGPYEIVNANATVKYRDGEGGGGGDFSLFVDDDRNRTCYIIYTSSVGIVVQRLDPTCTRTASGAKTSTPIHPDCEAPSMFKRNSTYYLMFGQKCCFCAKGTGVHVYRATHPLGPFTYQGQINRLGKGAPSDPIRVHAQQAAVSRVGGQWVWVGDRWQHASDSLKGHDPQAWLPLTFDASGRVGQLQWLSEWTPADL